jgi:hypothetical protein
MVEKVNFYSEWKNNFGTAKEQIYIKGFLNKIPESIECFLSGLKSDLIVALQVLLDTPIEKFISQIENESSFSAEDIVQFSCFDHACTSVCTCCEFSDKDLSFSELGKMIMHSKLDGACKKYGENHSKLAYQL